MLKGIFFALTFGLLSALYAKSVQKEKIEAKKENIVRAAKFEIRLFLGATIVCLLLSSTFFIRSFSGDIDALIIFLLCLFLFAVTGIITIIVIRWQILVGEKEITITNGFRPQKTFQFDDIDEMRIDLHQSIRLYSNGKKIVGVGNTSHGYEMLYNMFENILVQN